LSATQPLKIIGFQVGLFLIALTISVAVAIGSVQNNTMRDAEDSFELRPGVIVDATRGELYAMNPQHGIDAIDIGSGKILWSSNAAAKPLLVTNNHLVAQAEAVGAEIPIVILDAAAAGKPLLKATLPLPNGVNPSIDEPIGSSFEIHAKADGGSLIISWRFTRSVASGVIVRVPPPDIQMNGAAKIDLGTGGVKPMNPKQSGRGGEVTTIPKRLQRMVDSGALQAPPQPAGDFFVATKTAGDNHQRLLRWNRAGEPLASIDLDPGIGIANPSADNRMVYSRMRLEPDADGLQRYLWSIYSLETGKRVAQVQMPTSATPFFEWHSMLIFESGPFGHRVNGAWVQVPLQVIALSLSNGQIIWSHAIRDTKYRGQMPPMH